MAQPLDRLTRLAATVAQRLASMTLHEQIELLHLLQIAVTVQYRSKTPALLVIGSLPWRDSSVVPPKSSVTHPGS